MLNRPMLQPDLPVVTISRASSVDQQAEDAALAVRQRLAVVPDDRSLFSELFAVMAG